MVSVKQELKRYIDTMSEEDAQIVLSFFKRFIYREGPPLSAEEMEAIAQGEREIAKGEYISLDDFEQGKRL